MDMINIPELKKAWNLYSQKKLKFWQFDFIVFSEIPKWMVSTNTQKKPTPSKISNVKNFDTQLQWAIINNSSL